MKTMQIVIAVLLLAGTAFSQTVPVVAGEAVYVTTSAITDGGTFAFAAPGQLCTVLEVWPMHVIVATKASPATRLKVSRAKLAKEPLTAEATKVAVKARLLELDGLIAAKEVEIRDQKDKILRKESKGTLHRKMIDVSAGSFRTEPSKEELALKTMQSQLADLKSEKSQLQK